MKTLLQLLNATVHGFDTLAARPECVRSTCIEGSASTHHERFIYCLLIVLFGITTTVHPFRQNFDIDEMDTRTPSSEKNKESFDTDKAIKEQVAEPPMPIRQPLHRPAHLSPLEQEILDTFEYQLSLLADGLSALTASPEARQAREARLKERDQRVKEFQKQRASSEDRRWWQSGESPYRPSHRGGFSDFGGDGWRVPTSPRVPSYWTPPSTSYSEPDFGYPSTSPTATPSYGGKPQQLGLSSLEDEPEDDGTGEDEESGEKGDRKGLAGVSESKDNKKLGDRIAAATNALSGLANRIEKLNLTGTPTDKTAKSLTDQHIIRKLDSALEKAEDELSSLTDEQHKTLQAKCDELQKQKSRIEKLYPQLLPHVLRAATMTTNDAAIQKQQQGMSEFIAGKIKESPEISVALFNRVLSERQEELLAQMPKVATTRSITVDDPRIAYLQRAINMMPTGRGDHPNAGKDKLIQQLKTIESQVQAVSEKKETESESTVDSKKAEEKTVLIETPITVTALNDIQ